MAKRKKTADSENDFFEEIAQVTGGDVLDTLDSVKYFVDTGSLAVNYICSGQFINGGVPGGKLTEIFGPSSSSKSLIGTNILFGCQKLGGLPVLIDCENSANKKFIQEASHCDLKKILRYTPQSLEDVFHKIYRIIEEVQSRKGKDYPIVIVYDSITVSPCNRELREIKLPENYSEAEFKRIVKAHEQPGERAKVCSREFRKLNSVMEDSNATVVVLNQTREKIGILYGDSETTGGGGNALEFYASCRLRPQTQQRIERKITSKQKKILGINVKMKNRKNKTHRPFVESFGIKLLFDRGINPLSGLLSCLLDAERIEQSGKGWFKVNSEFAPDTEEHKFQSNLERNDVPMEILLKCPALIDASSTEQVVEYLKPYQSAMDFSLAEGEEEKDVREDLEEMIDNDIDEELS